MPAVDGVNYKGPFGIRIRYSGQFNAVPYVHVSEHFVDVTNPPTPGSDPADYDLPSRAGLIYNMETWVDDLVGDMLPFLHTSWTVNYAELWKYAAGSNNGSYQTTHPVNTAGTGTAAVGADTQTIWSMRSIDGSHGFFEILHTNTAPGPTLSYGASSTEAKDVFDRLTAQNSPALAKDGSYLFSPLNFLPGTSEHLFKKRFR